MIIVGIFEWLVWMNGRMKEWMVGFGCGWIWLVWRNESIDDMDGQLVGMDE
jgi:hypothetical protein